MAVTSNSAEAGDLCVAAIARHILVDHKNVVSRRVAEEFVDLGSEPAWVASLCSADLLEMATDITNMLSAAEELKRTSRWEQDLSALVADWRATARVCRTPEALVSLQGLPDDFVELSDLESIRSQKT